MAARESRRSVRKRRKKAQSPKRSLFAMIDDQRTELMNAYGVCHTLRCALSEESGISYVHGMTADVACKIIDRVTEALELIGNGKDPSLVREGTD